MTHTARGVWKQGARLVAALVCLVVLVAAGVAQAETDVTAKVQVVKKALAYNRSEKRGQNYFCTNSPAPLLP